MGAPDLDRTLITDPYQGSNGNAGLGSALVYHSRYLQVGADLQVVFVSDVQTSFGLWDDMRMAAFELVQTYLATTVSTMYHRKARPLSFFVITSRTDLGI